MKSKQVFTSTVVALSLFVSFSSFAVDQCVDNQGNDLPLNNAQAVAYKTNTPNGSTSRVHAGGPITQVFPSKNGHDHFEISIGTEKGDTLEVVYNTSFGELPSLKNGMQVEVCGDFINSYAPENGYPASPDGAIIHWIHKTDSKKHKAGFTIINGKLFGQGNGNGS